MIQYIFWILFSVYGIFILVSLWPYLTKKAPSGDAGVGWARGIFFLGGLGGVMALALLLRSYPVPAMVVLSLPLIILIRPRIYRFFRYLYVRFPTHADTPLLTLSVRNGTPSKIHLEIESWFGKAGGDSATLYDTIDFYMEPQQQSDFALTTAQTRVLAHKSK